MDIEDGPQAVAGIGLEVGAIPVFGALVEVEVLCDECLELRLYVCVMLAGCFLTFQNDSVLRIFFAGSSNSTNGTLASLSSLRKPTSDGNRNISDLPFPFEPRAVRPTRWM